MLNKKNLIFKAKLLHFGWHFLIHNLNNFLLFSLIFRAISFLGEVLFLSKVVVKVFCLRKSDSSDKFMARRDENKKYFCEIYNEQSYLYFEMIHYLSFRI